MFTSGLLKAGKPAPADYTSKPQREPRVVELGTRRILRHALHGNGAASTRTRPSGHVVRRLHSAGDMRQDAGATKVRKQPAPADKATRLEEASALQCAAMRCKGSLQGTLQGREQGHTAKRTQAPLKG